MTDKPRLNLSVDTDIPDLLETLAGGRNRMGDYISKLVRSVAAGATTATEIERMDRDGLKLMIQGLAGRVAALEGEMLTVHAKLADKAQ